MSRIRKKKKNPSPSPVASKVTVQGQSVKMDGPQGQARAETYTRRSPSSSTTAKKELVVTRPDDQKQSKAPSRPHPLASSTQHGPRRQPGDTRRPLEIQGVGYKAEMKGKIIVLSVELRQPPIPRPPSPATSPSSSRAPARSTSPASTKQAVGSVRRHSSERSASPNRTRGKGPPLRGRSSQRSRPGKAFAGAGAK